jgi:hypothetical protein
MIRIRTRGSVALTAAIVVASIVLSRVALPPGPAVLACVVVGILAGGLSQAVPSAPWWLANGASLGAVVGAGLASAFWQVGSETSLIALIAVAVASRLSSGLLISFAQRRQWTGDRP